MENVAMKVDGDKLIVTIDLKPPGVVSGSGKTKLVATTRGAVSIDYAKRPGLKLALNLMAPLS